MVQIRYKQSSLLIFTLKQQCKTISQIQQVHAQAITNGHLSSFHSTLILTQILHSFTSLLSSLPLQPNTHHYATRYFTSIFSRIENPSTFCYNTIIRAHTLLFSPNTSFLYFLKMHRNSVPPDSHTFPFVLKACALLNSLSLGKTLHSQALKFGFLADVFVCNNLVRVYTVSGNTSDAHKVFDESCCRDVVTYNLIIDGYVKAGEMDKARVVFDEMPERDAVSWGTLLAGYAKLNQCKEAIELFDQMVSLNVKFDNVALVSVLSACAQLGELEKGKTIHDYIKKKGIHIDSYLCTGLVDLYAKCGCIEIAREIFETSWEKKMFTWNAMLVGLAMHGHGQLLFDYFSRMVEGGVRPDGVTFLALLVGCNHAGLVQEARRFFGEMEEVYGVRRELKHYGCMADLLARAGLIKEAMEMIEAMPMAGDVFVWGGLLGGCRIHGHVELAVKAAENVMEVKPEDGGVYSILANVFADAGRWDDLVNVRRRRDCAQIKKSAGCSLIQLNGMIHEFISWDDLHPQSNEIYSVLNCLQLNLKHSIASRF
ncbi:pentatricopeptide repeat-containing protein At5g61800 [Nicotiana tomentosiformis]|uniref:pentatricopeptide repeat-containing protein At5g61800 n=1 Tax=Nicotiana tomentosiformis TaxID=4098 RepID=UPI00051B094F|nr:pentatricopeptide repeat-containing protein At5g61800 [Nicotiana tomentosiformis]